MAGNKVKAEYTRRGGFVLARPRLSVRFNSQFEKVVGDNVLHAHRELQQLETTFSFK